MTNSDPCPGLQSTTALDSDPFGEYVTPSMSNVKESIESFNIFVAFSNFTNELTKIWSEELTKKYEKKFLKKMQDCFEKNPPVFHFEKNHMTTIS